MQRMGGPIPLDFLEQWPAAHKCYGQIGLPCDTRKLAHALLIGHAAKEDEFLVRRHLDRRGLGDVDRRADNEARVFLGDESVDYPLGEGETLRMFSAAPASAMALLVGI